LSALQYYVYYKFDPARIEEVRAVVQVVFGEVLEATGVQGDWLQRRDDASTFMETYPCVTDAAAFDRALAQGLGKAAFARLGIERITEIFRCA